jgi:phospholipid N-methyltransferase
VVELGPGTGPITEEIAARLSSHTRYIGIERNRDFYETVKNRFPALEFFHDCAENTPSILRNAGINDGADAVISSLPWIMIPSEQWMPILESIKQAMKPGAIFVTFVYVSGLLFPTAHAFRRRLEAEFSKVETTPIVWLNVPPAFAYVCHR